MCIIQGLSCSGAVRLLKVYTSTRENVISAVKIFIILQAHPTFEDAFFGLWGLVLNILEEED